MERSGDLSAEMPGEKRGILNLLIRHLEAIGSANDAEDHGYTVEAQRMRDDACMAIRDLMAEHAFLAELFPKLQWELDTRHILGFGWAELHDAAHVNLKAFADGQSGSNVLHEHSPGSGMPQAGGSLPHAGGN